MRITQFLSQIMSSYDDLQEQLHTFNIVSKRFNMMISTQKNKVHGNSITWQ